MGLRHGNVVYAEGVIKASSPASGTDNSPESLSGGSASTGFLRSASTVVAFVLRRLEPKPAT